MGKEKKEKRKSEEAEELQTSKHESWEQKLRYLSPISKPLASRKLTKKLVKTVKKANKVKYLRKGIREVQKCVRKGEKGILILAGDVSPIDVISHMPVVSEEAGIPYCYIPSKDDLGSACGSKRQTCMVLIKQHDDYKDVYDECYTDVENLPSPI